MQTNIFLSGWLNGLGYADFAGSGVVHLLGGTCGLVATYLIGPRIGRFNDAGKPIDMPGHSVPLAGLGGFILLFGFLAFNGGSQVKLKKKLFLIYLLTKSYDSRPPLQVRVMLKLLPGLW